MALFNVRLDDGLAVRFDAWAALRGGRSAALRGVIGQACEGPRATPSIAQARQPRPIKLTVRLSPQDASALGREAASFGMTSNGWAAAALRWRLSGRATFAPAEAVALQRIYGEVHRIGINVNQIARALNTAVLEGKVLDLEMASIAELRAELRAHMSAIQHVHMGLQAYWSGAE